MSNQRQKDVTLALILNKISTLNQLQDVNTILDTTLSEARSLTHADAGSIFLVNGENLEFRHVQNDTLFGQKGAGAARYRNVSVPISEDSIVGFSALTREVVSIDDAYTISSDVPYRFNDSFDRKGHYHTTSILAVPLVSLDNQRLVGVMQLLNAQDGQGRVTTFSEQSKMWVQVFSNNAAAIIERCMLNHELILRMVKMAELHDPQETGAHVQRVSAYSVEIYKHWAEKKKVPKAEIIKYCDLLSRAALLHDAGKVGIPDAILKKPGPLTAEEYELMKEHTISGAALFTNISSELDQMTHDIVLHHHERWNGKGYPGRLVQEGDLWVRQPLAGEDIPFAARVVALADVFDALSSKRCYKNPWDTEKIYDEIRKDSGMHFDPELVEAFFEITDILLAIREKFT
ncbi:MAG: HD domain-containing phosphohydrolase [Candidatus Electrothrix aestuarii]|uniref:HD domain-containing phosphohydrolase n=1 Tax=Candidatus Electrothrix aestuarii TaxID=3062594 RepID=A0AAU8LQV1_9BACT|nr:HD domain-containing protein [Candidatus Electrothrix aestuarii]WPD24644.1 MAG: HD domain-containing protein [Candidatus Electrothrix sp. GW3-3]